MLTRDGERVLEVMLVASGLALAMVFQDGLPGQSASGISGLADHVSAFTQKADDAGIQDVGQSRAAKKHLATGPIRQPVADSERLSSRC